MSLLEQNITIKGQIDKKITEQLKFKAGNDNEKYEVGDICDSTIYPKKLEVGNLLGLYYLLS